ncbi:hypothetical protein TRFO_14524 [Tritrichomonas foetus]|uniref:Uncharacterized protein n=1 Tax=Tritrichomonas foetus TaxID=1144522 RepID=A0A1J4KUR9_9EUKA|nr:hypothetical protein TRFO_14524 [Tritrichomonas foetus]|eukprot:OHT15023.1 hypothetical protein TRFO_14524 [Tritrichomonas foetus]
MKQRKQNESSSLKNSIFGHDDSNNGIKTEENAQNSNIPETNNQANDNANNTSQNNVNNVVNIDVDGNRNALSNGKIESSASFAPENSQIRDRPSVEATTAIYFDVNSSDDDENDESQVVIRTSTTSEKMNDESGALADNSDSSGF